MTEQLHKRFTTDQIKALLEKYETRQVELSYILNILCISKRRFFKLLKSYREDKNNFSIDYKRGNTNNKIDENIEENIIAELKIEKDLIDLKDNPIKDYNYSYIRDRLKGKYKSEVSLPTIIDRAKKGGFYINKPKKKAHEREVVTNYVGELIQHDSSYHKFCPAASSKWYLITSIDDCSRYLLYYNLVESETSLSSYCCTRRCCPKIRACLLILL